ncbi:MAG: Zn-ribbon domain-containing OB-fold protein [Armatimonadetes bacterium]|nr:Zn-ribbon domain-containing OB-fold protein [Armatimonadota bacterium]MDW8154428.1 Zn-ribbon domain-containing OB-fold protein [Armatimonadota bacterium]
MSELGPHALVPLRPEVIRLEEGRGKLLGGRCRSCGAWHFPPPEVCARCHGAEVEVAPLSGRGVVYTYTVVHQSTPEFRTPYVLVYVDFPEGVRVLGQLVRCPAESVRIGMPVEVVFEEVGEDAEGRKVVGWRFQPASPAREGSG